MVPAASQSTLVLSTHSPQTQPTRRIQAMPPPRGSGPPREGEDPDQSEASSKESGVDQELSRENEAGYQEDGNPSFLSIPSACNCQGTPGIPEGTYSERGDGSSSNFCHHCTSPALGEDKELEEEYDDEETFKFPSDFFTLHPAEEGDFWAESSMLGLKIAYVALMDGKVYDITEWAGCQHVGISPDTHRVTYHISFGSQIPGTSGHQRATPDAPPADLQYFLSRIFQVSPGQMSNGNFFAAPQPGPGATAASKPNSTVPKAEAKLKRRKKVRRHFQL
ncbi:DnaJ-like protein subfamily C member 14 [Sciurus carolinensis]|uniref:DnaJ-like protein subfamily C member 14 n=1 Tax=Sciurus carolinensis TaxID=30640 RepID=A0AA41MQ91_SCICA|nr:DnaJ-like protein subfamily C member 14 [Sciurus carolinensis]